MFRLGETYSCRNIVGVVIGLGGCLLHITTCLFVMHSTKFQFGPFECLQVWASRNATPLWFASFDHSLRSFKKENVGAAELQELLNRTEVRRFITWATYVRSNSDDVST